MPKSFIKDKKSLYKKNGYIIIRNLLNNDDVKKLREKILNYFAHLPENKKDIVTLKPGDIIGVQDADKDGFQFSGRVSNTGTR